KLAFELRNPGHPRVEPDMLFEGSEIDQLTVQSVGRHSVAKRFLRLRCRLSNCAPYPFQNLLNFGREACDVLIDCPGICLFGFHVLSSSCNAGFVSSVIPIRGYASRGADHRRCEREGNFDTFSDSVDDRPARRGSDLKALLCERIPGPAWCRWYRAR